MEKKFTKSKLAVAVGSAALALAMSAPANAVVVVGGDNGWEVSFDGNINAFYNHGNYKYSGTTAGGASAGLNPAVGTQTNESSSRITSGFLPAFFSFNVKSPTVNGLTGSARISFAPTIQGNKAKNTVYSTLDGLTGLQGASIDTREVLANVEGNFGKISIGRTLSLFGRQAILSDMTLFGVGNSAGPDGGTVTAGRIGFGYTYPDFDARIAYATPDINGFKAEVGMYDPAEPNGIAGGGSSAFQTDIPRFEGEGSYATTFSNGGTLKAWVDGLWQDVQRNVAGGDTMTIWGFGGGANIGYQGFELTGYGYTGDGLGQFMQFAATGGVNGNAVGFTPGDAGLDNLGLGNAYSTACNGIHCETASNDGFYVQGTYTINGKTKVGISYGESNQDGQLFDANGIGFNKVRRDMWSIGVYHDVTSWLKLIAEYDNARVKVEDGTVANSLGQDKLQWDAFNVGAFFFW